jgi:hypothetical protein
MSDVKLVVLRTGLWLQAGKSGGLLLQLGEKRRANRRYTAAGAD